MMNAELYVNEVLACMPPATPRRSQIAEDLRSHIRDRIELGDTLEAVLAQLGDPSRLAESYLAEVPLVSASFGRRLAAKAMDLAAMWAVLAPVGYLAWNYVPPRALLVIVILLAVVGLSPLAVYTAISEYRTGQTLGKHLLGLRVVRDSGARISLGDAIVRQIPVCMQIHVIDGVFALFTEKSQRAFELLSKTRVVRLIS